MDAGYIRRIGRFLYVLDNVCLVIGIIGVVISVLGIVLGGISKSNITLALGVFVISVAGFLDYLAILFNFFIDGGDRESRMGEFLGQLKVFLLVGVGALCSGIWLWELLHS